MAKCIAFLFIMIYVLTSCNNNNSYKSIASDTETNTEESYVDGYEQNIESEEEIMVTCPICKGNGEGVFFDIYQICPVCKGDKVIHKKWIDEANLQFQGSNAFDESDNSSTEDQRRYIVSEISRLESVIQMAESGMESCTSEMLLLQYKNQIAEAEYEIRRLQGLLDNL